MIMRCNINSSPAMKGFAARLVMISMQVWSISAAAAAGPSSKMVRLVPAMYVLGDSTLDVGNNNYLAGPNVPRANMPLNGVDFPGGARATGRFSNGYNVADFIAMKLGLKESPQAYLSLAPRPTALVLSALATGVSYASAGAGILDSTNAGNNIPLSKQVRYFGSTKAAMEARVGGAAARVLLSRSFFLFSVGSNDLFVFAAAQPTTGDVAALYASLISGYSAAITDMYGMGARKFGVINVGLLGCVPAVRALSATGGCNDGLNLLSAGFDGALRSLLAGLAARLPGLAYSLADSYNLTQVTFANPAASGYVSIDSACCGSGRLGAETDCLPNSTLCADHDRFVFWDRTHPSQRAGELSAAAYFDGAAGFTAPISFHQLARKI
ncbi:GDSL esterase/lipase At5g55050 [Aegilops tauschii subsp. strangulata]|uniref:GDSL esterase/lipase n=1 Tax=Aegilops tauschii subsp. strangulata TaxID=200361 RepID=A0A453JKQ3_AEGTS|nr:GDSL esterase/lipase At5g55050 [Aegilops tauschii subsp. strangulata]